jgi:GGDEF domain-containing protein
VLLAGGSADPTDGTLVLPGLLVAVGALSGVLSGRQGDRLAFARRRVAELEEERERLRKILRAKNAIVRDLQGRFEEQAEPMESLYGMSRRMGSGEWEAMFPCLLDLLAHDLKVDRAAVYGLEDGRLVLRASHDPRVGTRPFPESLPSEGGLAGRALRERRVVSVFDPEAEGEPASGLLCGPLREGGAVRGLLLVEEMPLLEFSPVVVARFASLLRWAEESSERAARLREAGSADVDRETGTYSPGRLVETLEREIARAARYDTPLRLMLVRVRSFDALPEGYRRVARQNVACALGAQTRGIDTVCSVDRPDTFAVVLSMCRGEDPAPIQERVTRSLEGMWWPFPVRLAFASADLDGRPRTPGELLAEAEARLA